MTRRSSSDPDIFRLVVVFESGILVFGLALGWLTNTSPEDQLQLTWEGGLAGVLATGPLLLAMWWCSVSKLKHLKELTLQVQQLIVPLFAEFSVWKLLVVSAIAGLGEELLFRGVLQTALATQFGMWVALPVTSVLFGLLHLITPTYALVAALIGAYLGGLLYLTGNLLAPVVAHGLYDFVALLYLVGRIAGQRRVTPFE